MKLNWGTGIAIFYTLFAVAIVGMVVKASFWGVDLVEKDYYQSDINFESFRLEKEAYENLSEKISISYLAAAQQIEIVVPEAQKNLKGELIFYRPSNSTFDQTMPIALDETGKMLVPTNDLLQGNWTLGIQYEVDGIAYFTDTSLNL